MFHLFRFFSKFSLLLLIIPVYVATGFSVCGAQPLDKPFVRFLGPDMFVSEGAFLVLFFVSIAFSLAICSFITGVLKPLYRYIGMTAAAAAVYSLAVSGLGAIWLGTEIEWSYIALLFLWLLPAGICVCLQELFPVNPYAWIFRYAGRFFSLAATVSVMGVAAKFAGFSFFVAVYMGVLMLSLVVTIGLLLRLLGPGRRTFPAADSGRRQAQALRSSRQQAQALRLGRRHAQVVIAGILAVPGFTLAAMSVVFFGVQSSPVSYPALWGFAVLLGSLIVTLRLPPAAASRENFTGNGVKPVSALPLVAGPVPESASAFAAPAAVIKASCREAASAEAGDREERLKSKVAGFTHDINTPLANGMLTATHMQDEVQDLRALVDSGELKKSDLEKNLHAYKEAAEIIVTNLETASGLVRSFRREILGTAGAGPERQHFSVKKQLDKIVTAFLPRIRAAGHQLRCDCPGALTATFDPVVFTQIISNLIVNSLTHAYFPGMAGTLAITVKEERDGMSITYSDDGQGMDKKLQARIFEPYFTTNAGTGNSGLGLSIVHSLVTGQLGGTVTCDSAPGEGTVFTLYIPFERS